MRKNLIIFHLKSNIFTAVKYCCILHGRVCIMNDHRKYVCWRTIKSFIFMFTKIKHLSSTLSNDSFMLRLYLYTDESIERM